LADDDESDEALLARAGQGDRSAASALIARCSPGVLSLCRRLLRDRAGAEDAAQETFLKLWENAPRWRARGVSIEAWLYRVATNACVDRMRRVRRLAGEHDGPEREDGSPSAVEKLADEDRRRAVERALAQLPERQRIAMTLRHFQELSVAEAAEAMEISVEALESLLTRARAGLRAALMNEREELMEGVR